MNSINVYKLSKKNEFQIEKIILGEKKSGLDEISNQLPEGAYTTFRTFDHHKVLHFHQHIDRLKETSHLAGVPIQINEAILRSALKHLLNDFSKSEVRIRITVDLSEQPGDIYISGEPLYLLNKAYYDRGVKAITVQTRRDNPKAKLTDFLTKAGSIRKGLSGEVNEAIMLDEAGIMLEGLSSNFFAVYQDSIYTEEKNVLSGITRSIVLEEIRKVGYPLVLSGFDFSKVQDLQEAFITSTSRGVLPVIQIDDIIIGNGTPGPMTRLLMQYYEDHIRREIAPI